MLPYKSSSLVQNVFAVHRFAQGAADWRSGPRWSILSVLCPVHPFATTWHFPSRGNEKIGGTGYCVTYDTDSQSRNVLASPLGEEGHEVAKGCTRVRMIMILDVDVTAERRHYNTHRPLKGKRLTTFCASLALLHPLLSLTHWIFRSLMLPYKSSSHSAKCVRCAPKGNPQPSGPKAPSNLRTLRPRAGQS